MTNEKNQVIYGLTGIGKSSQFFKEVEKKVTINEPVLFVYKNYDLMVEQIKTWSKRFEIDPLEFCVCGTNTSYDKAMSAYTNPDNPRYMTKEARFIFCTQAVVQRNKHKLFFSSPKVEKQFKYIAVDEFDFTMGLVPTLDYQMSCITDPKLRGVTEINILRWVLENYTHEDYDDIIRERFLHTNNFFLANWIRQSKCPIKFLTAEVLATEFLELAGFEKVYVPSPDLTNCVINVWSSNELNRSFFTAMNNEMAWGKLMCEYDAIISDNVSCFSNRKDSDLTIISHTGARGSNSWINKKILTILSHIPNQAIQEICDVFKAFDKERVFEEVFRDFYRDRLCQAVGRTLGNRGGTITDLVVHESIMRELKNVTDFPYTFNTNWTLPLKDLDVVLTKAKTYKKQKIEHLKTAKKTMEIVTYGMLDNLFVKNKDAYIVVREIPEYLDKHGVMSLTGEKTLRATKIAKYFDVVIKQKRVNKKQERCIVGLDYAK